MSTPVTALLAAAAMVLVAAPALADRAPAGSLVDLSHGFGEDTVAWPTSEPFELEVGFRGEDPAGYYYEANSFATAEHVGTHLDAPVHFFAGGASVEEVPLERLVGPGLVIDVSAACAEDPDYLITIDDVLAWEVAQGRTVDDHIVLLHTGFGAYWPDPARYLGTTERGEAGVAALAFPGLDPAAARWLATERRIRAVGLDTASIDHGPSTTYASHVALFEHGIPAFENVAHLDALPPIGFEVMALPMKIVDGSGAPLRIVARID
jgi:kynurenine formamidase